MLAASQERRKGEAEQSETTEDCLTNLISYPWRWQGVWCLPCSCLQLMAESKSQQITKTLFVVCRVFCQAGINGLTEKSHQYESDYWESTVASPPAASASLYIYLSYAEKTYL